MKTFMFIIALSLVACAEDPVTPTLTPSIPEAYEVPAVNDGLVLSTTDFQALSEAVFGYSRILRTPGKSWRDVDRDTRSYLSRHTELVGYSRLERSVSHRILHERLLEADDSPALRAAISFYTERLVALQHPDTWLMSRALERLRNDWPDERIRTAAHTALEAARVDAEERRALCPDGTCFPWLLQNASAESRQRVIKLLSDRQRDGTQHLVTLERIPNMN